MITLKQSPDFIYFAVPLAPQNVTLPEDGRKNNSFVINLQDPNPDFTNWTIEVIENETNKTVYNKTYNTSNTNKNVEVGTNFTSGTLYRAVISTSVPGYSSRNKTTKRFFTSKHCFINFHFSEGQAINVIRIKPRSLSECYDKWSFFLIIIIIK